MAERDEPGQRWWLSLTKPEPRPGSRAAITALPRLVGLGNGMDAGAWRSVETEGSKMGGESVLLGDRARRWLPAALGTVVAFDLVGGIWDIVAGRASPAEAWGSDATLCAPWPMIAFQVVAVSVAVRSRRLPGRIAAGLVALACGVSVASGFFDGQLARNDLSPTEVGFQVLLLAVTGVLGGVAATVAIARPVVREPAAS